MADRAQAEDLVQDTVLATLRRPPAPTGSARAWLARVMRNLAVSRVRSETRRRAREQDMARPASFELGDQLGAQLEVQRRVVEAVGRLDEPYRTVILLRYFHELTAVEIAAKLDVPIATVRTRLSRGLARLRGTLDESDAQGAPAWSLVLLGGLAEHSRTTAGTALAAGGAVMGVKLVWSGVAVAVAAVAGTWWLLREPVRPAGSAALQLGAVATPVEVAGLDEAPRDMAVADATTARSPAVVAPKPIEQPPTVPDWSLELALRGWETGDTGPVRIEVLRVDADVPALSRTVELAERVTLDVGTLLAQPGQRPDRLALRIDHADFLPNELGVLVPEALLASEVGAGHLQAVIELERTSAVLTGRVDLADPRAGARARVAIHRLDGDRPARSPLEVVRLDAQGRYRLRAGAAASWVVVAFLAPEPGSPRARPASRTLPGPLAGGIELEPLELGPGAVVEGRVVAPGGAAPPPGSIRIETLRSSGYVNQDLTWEDGRFELRTGRAEWGEDGDFRVEGLAPGPYAFSLTSRAGPEQGIPKLQVEDSSAAIEVNAPASAIVLPFDRLRVLVEVVGDAGPVARAKVRATWTSDTGSTMQGTTADASGRVLLELGATDEVELAASDPELGTGQLSIAASGLTPGQTLELRITDREQAAGTLRVRAVGTALALPPDGGVNAFLYDLEQIEPEFLNLYLSSVPFARRVGTVFVTPSSAEVRMVFADGSWTVTGLPRSRLHVRLLPATLQRGEKFPLIGTEFEVDLRSEALVEHDWELRAGGFLRLDLTGLKDLRSAQLVAADGSPLALSYSHRIGSDGHSSSSVATAPEIFDVLPTLEAGRYLLQVTLVDDSRHQVPLIVEAGQVNDVVVRPDDL